MPNWLREVLTSAFPSDDGFDFAYVTATEAGERPIRAYGVKTPELVVKAVCEKCNGGWMSALEGDTKPILEPMVRGEATHLDEAEQVTLARWSAKIAVLLEHYEAGSVILGPTDLTQIWQDGHAPLGYHIRLALRAEDHPMPFDVLFSTHLASPAGDSDSPAEDEPANSFSVTLGFGRIAIAVVGGPGVENPERWARTSDRPLTIWPPTMAGIGWPPSHPVLRSREEFRQFHESFWRGIVNPNFPRPDAFRHPEAATEAERPTD